MGTSYYDSHHWDWNGAKEDARRRERLARLPERFAAPGREVRLSAYRDSERVAWLQIAPDGRPLETRGLDRLQWTDGSPGDALAGLGARVIAETVLRLTIPAPHGPVLAEGTLGGDPVELSVDRFGLAKVIGAAAEELPLYDAAFAADPFDWARRLPRRMSGLRWRRVSEGPTPADESLVDWRVSGLDVQAQPYPASPPTFPHGLPDHVPSTVAAPGREVLISFHERGSTRWEVHVAADGRVLGADNAARFDHEPRGRDGRPIRFVDAPEDWAFALAVEYGRSEFWGRVQDVVRTSIPAPGESIAARIGRGTPEFLTLGVSPEGAVTLLGDASAAVGERLRWPAEVPGTGPLAFADDPVTWLRYAHTVLGDIERYRPAYDPIQVTVRPSTVD
ncbi:hypothetical protein EV193_102450 [Herbihabitans rhizosphaerae]|uniref:Uncharacterized protein n=1 Tax=Herbihabitans rhizosphaerae TaxID=1872711 RepID=A0A4Q7L3X9_9PSEU|nr:hypothetical protein [Herbihabitans rhizosphaerae]RZS43470.1 hypothetical protein EV193_102450 [Herbihabitans rhizosphaerae]